MIKSNYKLSLKVALAIFGCMLMLLLLAATPFAASQGVVKTHTQAGYQPAAPLALKYVPQSNPGYTFTIIGWEETEDDEQTGGKKYLAKHISTCINIINTGFAEQHIKSSLVYGNSYTHKPVSRQITFQVFRI